MRIAVFGPGAVGGYFGGRLARSGQDVVFIARGEHLKALKTKGMTIEEPDGHSDLFAVKATGNPAEVGPADAIILGVKAWQVAEAADLMRPLIGPDTFVVPLQNGVEAPIILSEKLGANHVFGGVCYIVSFLVAPGEIRHAGMTPRVVFGELDNKATQRGQKLREAFQAAGISVEMPADISAAMWQKFLFIASMSGVGAVTRAPMGIIRSIPETRSILESAVKEAAAVASVRGIRLADNAAQAVMEIIDSLPAESTASMQRDIMEGRPSELFYQSGSIVRLGTEAGTPTPVHSFLYGALLPMELKARGEVQF